jgi:hypothetical protein
MKSERIWSPVVVLSVKRSPEVIAELVNSILAYLMADVLVDLSAAIRTY